MTREFLVAGFVSIGALWNEAGAQPAKSEVAVAIAALQGLKAVLPAGKRIVLSPSFTSRNASVAKALGLASMKPREALVCPATPDLAECTVPHGLVLVDVTEVTVAGNKAKVRVAILTPTHHSNVHKHVHELLSVELSCTTNVWTITRITPLGLS
ncbi:MAG: hypothetical protein M3O61_18965 [Gemmatimonadota bacterium]|nr:hypothetical protein [Gemmatimonadota bacterium]